MKTYQSKNRGFTIIEVMIVLAIAGLIMLIVFLAVPALQRTARNTQRSTDAAAALAAVNNYVTNNGGALPTAAGTSFAAPVLTVGGGAGTAAATANLGYYTANVTLSDSYSAPSNAQPDSLHIYKSTSCLSATQAQPSTSSRQVAVVYGIETGSNAYAWQCKDS